MKYTFKDYDAYSIQTCISPYEIDDELESLAPVAYTTKTCEQDSSLLPTLAVSIWLGTRGFIALFFIGSLLFLSMLHKVLVIVLLTLIMLFPRHRERNLGTMEAKAFVLELALGSLFLVSLYLKAFTMAIMVLSLILPRDFPRGLGNKIGDWIMHKCEQYFALKTTLEDEDALAQLTSEDDPKGVVVAIEPHDIMPYGAFAFYPGLKRIPGRVGKHGFTLISSLIFNIPLMRNVFSWVCCGSVDKQSFRKHLRDGKTVIIIPGGIQEVTMMDPQESQDLVVLLKKRKGFVKLALETGSPIVPAFCFHLDGSFAYYIPRGDFISKLARRIGFLPVIYMGRFWIPFGIPRPQQIHVVIGKPIYLPTLGRNVRQEDVDKYHEIYVQQLKELYNRHNHANGYGERALTIM
jgi:2-acylglycerol O-acyltransferase 2